MYVLPDCYHEDIKLLTVSILTLVNSKELKRRESELEWFCGFSEAESIFFISNSGALSFRIKLHRDDRESLVYIKNLLSELAKRDVGIIVDSKGDHESYYTISKFQDILEIIIPIFSTYYFTTSKFLDFQDFKAAAEIKKSSFMEKKRLTEEELNNILKLKLGMNSQRVSFNINDLPKRSLTPYRLLGFIEGDGTFCLSNMIPTFSIKQHSKNIHFLYEIADYLVKLSFNPEIGPKIDNLNTKPTPGISKSSISTSILTVTNILQLYNYILPFFKTLTFKTRKAVDFELWELAVKLKVLGFTTTPEGRLYFIKINNYINKRYSNRAQIAEEPNIKQIKLLLNNPPVFDLASGLSYKALSDLVKVSKKGHSGFGVNVYDNGNLVSGSPFPSYTQAALALGNINFSSAISKKIDTGKLFKGRYKFESSI